MLDFKSQGHLTLGVEIELQLIDPKTLDLKPVAYELFPRTAHDSRIKPEIFQSMAEINTGICTNVQEAEADMRSALATLKAATDDLNVHIATVGTHPFARYADRRLYSSERYEGLIDRNQWIARRLMIFGLHVHLGMRDGDTCMRFNNFFLHMIPHLLALTASSPFWQGADTGLASCRSTIFESCPTAGHPCRIKDWQDFSDLCSKLVKSKAIGSHKDLWWDIRPSPDFGTLEIRICDGLATLSEAFAVIAFIHALAHWYEAHTDYDVDITAPFMWMMRENKWRAARHGLDAEIIVSQNIDLMPIREDIALWLRWINPQMEQLCYEPYFGQLRQMLEMGTSYQRQRAVLERTGSMGAVVEHNIREFLQDAPSF